MDGFLFIDKPGGLTSHDVVDTLRRRLHVKQVGHAGTLDPLATGLLICAIGVATRTLEYLSSQEKEYEGTLRLGIETDTGDVTGDVTRTVPLDSPPTRDEIVSAASRLTGEMEQTPPVYSAVKVEGRPAHRRVRAGESVELAPRRICVSRFEIVGARRGSGAVGARRESDAVGARRGSDAGEAPPAEADFTIACSAGTYVRVLVSDLGRLLGCGATLSALRRTRIGSISLADAVSLDRIGPGMAADLIRPIDSVLTNMPRLRVRADSERRIRNGSTLGAEDLDGATPEGLVTGPARCVLVGVARVVGDYPCHPDRFAGIARIEALDPLVFRLHKNLLPP